MSAEREETGRCRVVVRVDVDPANAGRNRNPCGSRGRIRTECTERYDETPVAQTVSRSLLDELQGFTRVR